MYAQQFVGISVCICVLVVNLWAFAQATMDFIPKWLTY